MKQESLTTYGLEEQKIVQGLKQRPDIGLLSCINTLEQLAAWLYSKLFYVCVAESWQAIHGTTIDPGHELLKAGLIEEPLRDRASLTAVFYQRAWELIVVSYPSCLQPELVRLGLNDRLPEPFEYFGWIVCHDSDYGFKKCLKPFYNFQARKHSRACRLVIKALAEDKPLPGSMDDLNPAVCLLLVVTKKKATTRNRRIKSAYEAFKAAAIELYNCEAEYYWDTPSHQWINGHYERGSKEGGTYKRLPWSLENPDWEVSFELEITTSELKITTKVCER
jgi:hypothetical protein